MLLLRSKINYCPINCSLTKEITKTYGVCYTKCVELNKHKKSTKGLWCMIAAVICDWFRLWNAGLSLVCYIHKPQCLCSFCVEGYKGSLYMYSDLGPEGNPLPLTFTDMSSEQVASQSWIALQISFQFLFKLVFIVSTC